MVWAQGALQRYSATVLEHTTHIPKSMPYYIYLYIYIYINIYNMNSFFNFALLVLEL